MWWCQREFVLWLLIIYLLLLSFSGKNFGHDGKTCANKFERYTPTIQCEKDIGWEGDELFQPG
jgi:hypothetical protein